MARQAIRHEGDTAKQLFRQLVPNSRQSSDIKRGDTEVLINGHWHYVDIKQCQSNTINQVRAIKFIPLIIFNGEGWYVIPPIDLVKIVALKSRGQHTEIPFECASLSIDHLDERFRCNSRELYKRVLIAFDQSKNNMDMKEVMDNLLSELQTLNEQTKKQIESF